MLLNDNTMEPTLADKMETDLVFVYGSLKDGGRMHHALKGATFVCHGMSRKAKYGLFTPNDMWPVLTKGDFRVKGEVYRINKDILAKLDWVEGHPNLFIRMMFKLYGMGEKVYVYKGSTRLCDAYEDLDYKSDLIKTDTLNRTQEWIIE